MASPCTILQRGISTSCACYGKRNFRKFQLFNKRGTKIFKQQQATNPDPDVPVHKRGVKDIGYLDNERRFVMVPEMIPELIVPSLEGFELQAYVSYAVNEVTQSRLTPRDLFDAVYSKKITDDFSKGKLGPDGESLEPSEQEKLTPKEAKKRAEQTGCDLFTQETPRT